MLFHIQIHIKHMGPTTSKDHGRFCSYKYTRPGGKRAGTGQGSGEELTSVD